MSRDTGQRCDGRDGLTDNVAAIGSTCTGARLVATTATVIHTVRRRDQRRNWRGTGRGAGVERRDEGGFINNVCTVQFVIVSVLWGDAWRGVNATKYETDQARNGRAMSCRSGGMTKWCMAHV